MTISSERARIGGQARSARMSPEQRSTLASKAWLASAVNGVIRRFDQLTPDQRSRLAVLFADPAEVSDDQPTVA